MAREGSANLQKRVFDMVAAYVNRKTESRSGFDWNAVKEHLKEDNNSIVKQYREVREKICSGAFLAIRSRKSREDFTAYFTGTICSVPQFLPQSEYDSLADALLGDHWEDVKSLSMLALAGLSRI
jgi:CRISPR-associated protein Cmx8